MVSHGARLGLSLALPKTARAEFAMSDQTQPPADDPRLGERVAALEEQVTQLRDTSALEDRIVEKLRKRLPKESWIGRLNPFRSANIPASGGWLVWDLLSEARFLLAMLFDRRFPLAWTSKIGLTISLALIVTSPWWFPASWFPVIGAWIDKAMTLVLAFFVFKILNRETQRYRKFLESLG